MTACGRLAWKSVMTLAIVASSLWQGISTATRGAGRSTMFLRGVSFGSVIQSGAARGSIAAAARCSNVSDMASPSVGIAHAQHRADRARENQEIEAKSPCFDVFKIAGKPSQQLFLRVCLAAPAAHLRQAGHTRPHIMPYRVPIAHLLERNAAGATAR